MGKSESIPKDSVKKYSGVTVRGNSVSISFVWPIKSGKVRHVTLKGLEPNENNLEYAESKVKVIKQEIAFGIFSWSNHFPEHKLATLELKKNASYTVKDLLNEYLKYILKRKEGITIDTYTYSSRKFIIPELGEIAICDFTSGHATRWVIKSMNEGRAKTTIAKYIAPLRSAFKMAMQLEYIKENPFSNFVWPEETKEAKAKKNQRRKQIKVDVYTIDEISRILAACDREQERNAIQFGFWTGLRPEELFAVHWQDIDLVMQKAEINKAKVQRRGYACIDYKIYDDEVIKGIKTGELGERTLDLLPKAVEALKRQKQWTYIEGTFVFHNPFWNRPWESSNQFRNRFEKICHKAGVRYRRPYSMRHTYASLMLKAGEDESWVATQLGHVDTTMIRKIYRQFIPDGDGQNGGYRFKNDWGTGVLNNVSSGQT